MIFRQLFDPVSSTYTYLLADHRGGEALLIDPVIDRVDQLRDRSTRLHHPDGPPADKCRCWTPGQIVV